MATNEPVAPETNGNNNGNGNDNPKENQLTIYRLQNSVQFYLECVFILVEEDNFQLVIIHSGNVLMDAKYGTLRGARIAFTKYFGQRARRDEAKPNWSHSYHPDDEWLQENFEILKKYRS